MGPQRVCELAVFLERERWEQPTPNKYGTGAGERKGCKDGGSDGVPGGITLVTPSREMVELSEELPARKVSIRKLVARSFCSC